LNEGITAELRSESTFPNLAPCGGDWRQFALYNRYDETCTNELAHVFCGHLGAGDGKGCVQLPGVGVVETQSRLGQRGEYSSQFAGGPTRDLSAVHVLGQQLMLKPTPHLRISDHVRMDNDVPHRMPPVMRIEQPAHLVRVIEDAVVVEIEFRRGVGLEEFGEAGAGFRVI
jgi:hypothetical protein